MSTLENRQSDYPHIWSDTQYSAIQVRPGSDGYKEFNGKVRICHCGAVKLANGKITMKYRPALQRLEGLAKK